MQSRCQAGLCYQASKNDFRCCNYRNDIVFDKKKFTKGNIWLWDHPGFNVWKILQIITLLTIL